METIKRYRLIEPMPLHEVGDTMYAYPDDIEYQWETGDTSYKLPAKLVESDAKFFEQVYGNFIEGQQIYFVSGDGTIIEEEFIYTRHKKLINFGNIFTDIITANQVREKFGKVLSGESILFSKEDVEEMYILLINGDIFTLKSKLNVFI
jgi:hypothetical protein